MQILHTGRYSYSPFAVAPSAIKSPISPFKPSALSKRGIERTIKHFVRAAMLAKYANYDGVEIMGSEGYLINQFIAKKTNHRTDEWGGSYENRIKFALEIIGRTREAVGENFILIFRLSMLDLVEGGSSWPEVVQLAKEVEKAGATMINTGIGWHEARIPTIGTMVPRGAFTWVTRKMKGEVSIPLITTNRINMPDTAEKILADGDADMISMARPFLADPELVKKAEENRADEINTCIGCNQACLDHVFKRKIVSCLVNPRACHETELNYNPTLNPKKIAVVGAGPAGMAASTVLAERGHKVTLFEASDKIGGQFNIAKQIPGKEEFYETIRYFGRKIELTGVDLKLNTKADTGSLIHFDEVLLSTGIKPRTPKIEGINHSKVLGYLDVLRDKKTSWG
jgi:2,4-dienoyl-CoA reductase (NADPH2)